MSKIILFQKFVAMFVMASLIIGCNTEKNSVAPKSNTNERLVKELSDFNQSKLGDALAIPDKCTGWKCLGYAMAIGSADIIGAGAGIAASGQIAGLVGLATGGTGAVVVGTIGGVISGGGASYAAARKADTNFKNDIVKYGDLVVVLPSEYLYLSNIGIEHNQVIHNNFYNNLPLDEYYKDKNLTSEQFNVLTSPEMMRLYSKISLISESYVEKDFDYTYLTQEMVNNGFFTSNMKRVMDLFMGNYRQSSDFYDAEKTINFYIEKVAESELSSEEKRALIGAFVVASQSPFYFYQK